MDEECPVYFRDNGFVVYKNVESEFFGIEDGWLMDIGLLPRDDINGTTYKNDSDDMFDGCAIGIAEDDSYGEEAVVYLFQGFGVEPKFALSQSDSSEILDKVHGGTEISPKFEDFSMESKETR